jgi:lysozyme family protein
MSSFEEAVQYVLANEGGLSEDPHDPGGLTQWGISQKSYPGIDIRALTRDEAIAIYKRDYWKYDGFASQRVATKVFDMAVNSGEPHAVKVLQMALQSLQVGPIVADGILGTQTIEHANAADETTLMDELKAVSSLGYCLIVIKDQNRMGELKGWLRRAVKG